MLAAPMRRALAAPLLVALLAGCPGPGAEPAPTPPSAAPPGSAALAALGSRVGEACGRCHRAPPPDSLPRARFAEKVPEMRGMPLPPGVAPLTDEELAAAAAWYAATAPEALEAPPAIVDEPRLRFEVTGHTPPGLEGQPIPAVAHLRFLALSDPRRLDLLACELRTRHLFLLAPWAPPEQRRFRLLARELVYPCRTEPVDLDQDGLGDLLVAGLGGINPGNEEQGAALWLRQTPQRAFEKRPLATGLARPTDVRAADLDQDGDLDLAVSAFGWRGPGRLLLLEQRPGAGGPAWEPHALDDRDGFIHVEPWDLDQDGRVDLVALLAQEHEQVLAFLNRGQWRFEARVLHQAPHPAWGSSGLQRVDLDGDGDEDLLLSNGDALDDGLIKPYHGVAWLERRGPLQFAWRRIAAFPGCERALAGDLDGDGDLDVVAVAFLPQLPPREWEQRGLASVVWVERLADGAWAAPRALERGRCYHPALALGDYDQDGALDLAVGSWVWLEEDGTPRYTADHVTLFRQRR
jgi:hypothetical protein